MNEENNTGLPDTEEQNDTTSNEEEFDIDKFEKNLEDNSVSEEVLRYQNLIKNQDQLITNLKDEIKTLKERNLSLAQSVSSIDKLEPKTTQDILAAAFLK